MLQQQNTRQAESRTMSTEELRKQMLKRDEYSFPANWGQEFADNLNRNVLLEAQEDERVRQMRQAN